MNLFYGARCSLLITYEKDGKKKVITSKATSIRSLSYTRAIILNCNKARAEEKKVSLRELTWCIMAGTLRCRESATREKKRFEAPCVAQEQREVFTCARPRFSHTRDENSRVFSIFFLFSFFSLPTSAQRGPMKGLAFHPPRVEYVHSKRWTFSRHFFVLQSELSGF